MYSAYPVRGAPGWLSVVAWLWLCGYGCGCGCVAVGECGVAFLTAWVTLLAQGGDGKPPANAARF